MAFATTSSANRSMIQTRLKLLVPKSYSRSVRHIHPAFYKTTSARRQTLETHGVGSCVEVKSSLSESGRWIETSSTLSAKHHIPVLLQEVVKAVCGETEGVSSSSSDRRAMPRVLVDGTMGAGGHAVSIIQAINRNVESGDGRGSQALKYYIGFDVDPLAHSIAMQALRDNGCQLVDLEQQNGSANNCTPTKMYLFQKNYR